MTMRCGDISILHYNPLTVTSTCIDFAFHGPGNGGAGQILLRKESAIRWNGWGTLSLFSSSQLKARFNISKLFGPKKDFRRYKVYKWGYNLISESQNIVIAMDYSFGIHCERSAQRIGTSTSYSSSISRKASSLARIKG
jgi:hypothetical protein